MRYYIGSVTNSGIVRMLNNNREIVPHVLGGVNSEGEQIFESYEESEVNRDVMIRNGLRFLTKEEVAHFMAGENIRGEKIPRPTRSNFTKEELDKHIKICKLGIEVLKEKGEDYSFLVQMIKAIEETQNGY